MSTPSICTTDTEICTMMQPTYFPWLGYFNLIQAVDTFVFLDDVQFARRSWQSRNRILINKAPYWLSVPIKKATRDTLLSEIEVQDEILWREQHYQHLKHHYGSAPYAKQMFQFVEEVLFSSELSLSRLNQRMIQTGSKHLGLSPTWICSSDLQVEGTRSKKLLAICSRLGMKKYLSANGAREYIEEEGIFANSSVDVIYHNFQERKYPQKKQQDPFVSHLAILDSLAYVGWKGVRQLIQ